MIEIRISTDGKLSNDEKALLLALAGATTTTPEPVAPAKAAEPVRTGKIEPVEFATSVEPEPEPEPEPKAKPAKRTPAKKEKPAMPSIGEGEPEVPEKEEEPAPDTSGVDAAVSLASELLQSGEVAKVKAVLAEMGVTRVSKLEASQADEFMEKVQA